ncbi:hypothetical protein BH23VER1_BH23VER1_07290 [soil metagenome]
MSTHQEHLREQFAGWERLGNGGLDVHDGQVSPQPPFFPFAGYRKRKVERRDDGVRRGGISGFFGGMRMPKAAEEEAEDEGEPELETDPPSGDEVIEIKVTLPMDYRVRSETFGQILRQLDGSMGTFGMDACGTADEVGLLFTAGADDAGFLTALLETYFPEAVFESGSRCLEEAWVTTDGSEPEMVVELGLACTHLLPLAKPEGDIFFGLVAALSALADGEVGTFQVLFQPVDRDWSGGLRRLVLDAYGDPVFGGEERVTKAAVEKASQPLHGVVIRLAARGRNRARTVQILTGLAAPLSLLWDGGGNGLVPLSNDGYDPDDHLNDLVGRKTRRSGMLLTERELNSLVHLPPAEVRSPKLSRQILRTKAAPPMRGGGVSLGENAHRGEVREVFQTAENRVRHTHLVGAMGTGKSTLLSRLILQDIESGQGLAVLDPHGDLIDGILAAIPEHRIEDVVLLDPADEVASVGFNILTAHSEAEKVILASDLISIFRRLSSSWGDQMDVLLRNAILAFLESSAGGTLSDLRRFLIDDRFRREFLETVGDPDVRFYWEIVYPKLGSKASVGAVVTRLETFLAPKPIRNVVAQGRNSLDFASIMDGGKIFLARLAQGAVGRENASLLGSLIVSKIQQTAMARQRVDAAARRDFWCYIDEFQNFITPSMAEIITEARKLRLGMVLAHQELGQLQKDSDVSHAVMSVGTRIVFRVSDADARVLEQGFRDFGASDIQALELGHAICRIDRSDHDFNLRVPFPADLAGSGGVGFRDEIVARSRAKYSTPREQIEAERSAQFSAPPVKAVEPEPVEGEESAPFPSPAPPPVVEAPALSPPPATVSAPTPGLGGAGHKEIQQAVKRIAEAAGYRVTIEKPTPDKTGSVDVALERSDGAIAVEISVSTSVRHEIANIQKCLAAGYPKVLAVVVGKRKRGALIEEIAKKFPDAGGRVACIADIEVSDWLRPLDAGDDVVGGVKSPTAPSGGGATPAEAASRGFTIRRKFADTGDAERTRREAATLEILARALRGEG